MASEFPFEKFFSTANFKQETIHTSIDNNTKLGHESIASENEILEAQLLNHFANSIPQDKFNTYFKDRLSVKNVSEKTITLEAKTPFIKSVLEASFQNHLEEVISSFFGMRMKIRIETSQAQNDQNTLTQDTSAAPKTAKNASFKLDLGSTVDDLMDKAESTYINHVTENKHSPIDQKKTFESFVKGASNQMAYATAKAVASMPGKTGKYPCLYIYSDSGLGKTHLLHAVGNEINKNFPELAVCFITARDFMQEMVNSISKNTLQDFRKKYSEKVDVLMIDDIHELKNKEGTQDEFFHVFNELHSKGKQLIFTSDVVPNKINGLKERIKTRLQWGLVIDIQRPDIETRTAILKKKANELDLYLPEDVLNMIATSIKSSIRELEGNLVKLSAYADFANQDLDCDMVKELLRLSPEEDQLRLTIEAINKATCQYYKVSTADVKSKSRSQNITKARHVSMYLCRKLLSNTQEEIGRFFGNRDHTSVIHAVTKVTTKLKEDSELSKDIILIESNLS